MLELLPSELAILTLHRISPAELGACRQVCKAWRALVDNAVQQRQPHSVEAAVSLLLYGGPLAGRNPTMRRLLTQLPAESGTQKAGAMQVADGLANYVLAIARDRQLVLVKCTDCSDEPVAAERVLIDEAHYEDANAWTGAVRVLLALCISTIGLQHVATELVCRFLTPTRAQHEVPGYDTMVSVLANAYDRKYLLSLLASTVFWHDGKMYGPSAAGLLHTSRILSRTDMVAQEDTSGQCMYGALKGCMRARGVTVTQAFYLMPALCSVVATTAISVYRTRHDLSNYLMVTARPVGAETCSGLQLQHTFDAHFAPVLRGDVRSLIGPYSIFSAEESVCAMVQTLLHN